MGAHGDVVRIGVLGTSSFARRKMVPALLRADGVEVVAVASRSAGRAEELAGQAGCEAVVGYDTLLARDDLDAVYVSVPNSLHLRWGREVLARGLHLLAEKPVGTDPGQARELIGLAHDRGLVLRVNIGFFHHDQHAVVRGLVDDGRIGVLRSVATRFTFPAPPPGDIRLRQELGGGALLDQAIYPLAVANAYCTELRMAGATLVQDPDTGVDVAASFLALDPTGVIASGECGIGHHYAASYRLTGSDGEIVVDRAFTPPPDLAPRVTVHGPDGDLTLELPARDQLALGVEHFATSVRRTRALGHDPEHALMARRVLRRQHELAAIRRIALTTAA